MNCKYRTTATLHSVYLRNVAYFKYIIVYTVREYSNE